MTKPSEHAGKIVELAGELDDLVERFREIKAKLDDHETEIRKASPGQVFAVSGQARLAETGHGFMMRPRVEGDRALADIAKSAWSAVLDI